MEIGRHVRRAFGPFEIPVSKAYRRVYVDLDAFAKALCCLYRPRTIVEVGCGDGLFATCLARVFPDATILGVDIARSPGRLFEGNRSRVEFRSEDVSTLLRGPSFEPFDLAIVADVIHHVPDTERNEFLENAEHSRVIRACW